MVAGHLGVETPGDPATSPPVSDTGETVLQATPGQRKRNCQLQKAHGNDVQFPSETGSKEN